MKVEMDQGYNIDTLLEKETEYLAEPKSTHG
jgi:hypothetical protein